MTVLLAVGGAAIVGGLFLGLYLPGKAPSATPGGDTSPSAPSYVQLDGYDLILSYTAAPGQSTGYFDSPDCGSCPLNLTPSGFWHLSFSLRNADLTHAHNVTSIVLDAPFTVESVSPSLPAAVGSGGSLTLAVDLQLPATPGYYFLTGSINAD